MSLILFHVDLIRPPYYLLQNNYFQQENSIWYPGRSTTTFLTWSVSLDILKIV